MGLFESIADRRIREARAAGYFDDLPGAGKPIPDLDTERPPGWWASRVVKTERDKMRYDELGDELRAAMPPLWRSASEAEVRGRVATINETIAVHNARTSFQPRELLNPDQVVRRWNEIYPAKF